MRKTSLITAVLLVDGWHLVAEESFMIYDQLNFVDQTGGDTWVLGTSFFFLEVGVEEAMYGPMTSILAVRCKEPDY